MNGLGGGGDAIRLLCAFLHWASTPANHSEWRRRFLTARSACDTPRQGKALPPNAIEAEQAFIGVMQQFAQFR